MNDQEFLESLPLDICDSCFYIGSPNCPKGIGWRYSDERIQSRLLDYDECDQYVYWRELYRALKTTEARVREYGMNIWEKSDDCDLDEMP